MASTGSAIVISALMVAPFGQLTDLIHGDKPFYGFDAENAVLTEVRVQRVGIPKCVSGKPCACQAWSDALLAVSGDEFAPLRTPAPVVQASPAVETPGLSSHPETSGSLNASAPWSPWGPWSSEELEEIRDCDHFPCDVKLDSAETAEMKKSPEANRFRVYLGLVDARVGRYRKTQARKEYEFPGDPVDPWKIFEQRGFKPAVERPVTPSLFLRTLSFSSRIKKIRQVLDRRAARTVTSNGTQAAVWVRDVYTNHYFDSWGELYQIDCDPEQGDVTAVFALLGELDMLKKTGLFESAFRPKYRSAFEDNSKVFLDRQFERVQKEAERPR